MSTARHALRTPAVEDSSTTFTTSPVVFTRDKKRVPPGVVECPTGRSGTLRPACEANSPAESGPAVSTLDARSDTEPGSPDLTKRGPGRPERGRSGEFTVLTSSHECRRMGLYSQPVHRRREGSPLADGEVEGRASVACDRESGLYFSRRGVCIRISDSTAPLRNDEDITVSLVVGFIPRLNSGTTTARSCNANRTQ